MKEKADNLILVISPYIISPLLKGCRIAFFFRPADSLFSKKDAAVVLLAPDAALL